MNNLEKLTFGQTNLSDKPSFYGFEFEVEERFDTYLDMSNWGKGFVTLNGFNVGRYWDIDLQTKLSVPASFLKKGKNEVIVFEENKPSQSLIFSV